MLVYIAYIVLFYSLMMLNIMGAKGNMIGYNSKLLCSKIPKK